MKRGFLLHNRKPDRSAVSQRVASTSPPSPHSAMLAHAAIVQHASALAFLTREPAVLWLCRGQESKEAVMHFQKRAREREDRFAEHIMEALACAHPDAKLLLETTGMARLAEASDEATRRKIIKDLRKLAKEAMLHSTNILLRLTPCCTAAVDTLRRRLTPCTAQHSTAAVDTLLHSTNILLRTWFNTLMHVVNESSGGEHPAAFLLAGVLARRMAYRGDSHPAKRAMHSERKFFSVR